jgi:hypothetical protein
VCEDGVEVKLFELFEVALGNFDNKAANVELGL